MGKGKRYVQLAPAAIEQARQMDLLSYLRLYEPENLIRIGNNAYRTREHDSLKISGGKWYWWSQGIGGKSALDYLIKVKGCHFVDAVEALSGKAAARIPTPRKTEKQKPKMLLLPPKSRDQSRLIRYLTGRGIDRALVQRCIAEGLVYESADYHSAIFIGKDENGVPKYATCRSTYSDFKGDVSGSDKRYSFQFPAKEPQASVHIFESAIDLLSYATYLTLRGRDYEKENLLSLSGVYQPKKETRESKVPVAVTKFLENNPQTKTVILHLDNDRAGRIATNTLKILLEDRYEIIDRPPPSGKDVNDFLLLYTGTRRAERVQNAACR